MTPSVMGLVGGMILMSSAVVACSDASGEEQRSSVGSATGWDLSVEVQGSGVVKATRRSNAPAATEDCGATCVVKADDAVATIELVATPTVGFVFDHWETMSNDTALSEACAIADPKNPTLVVKRTAVMSTNTLVSSRKGVACRAVFRDVSAPPTTEQPGNDGTIRDGYFNVSHVGGKTQINGSVGTLTNNSGGATTKTTKIGDACTQSRTSLTGSGGGVPGQFTPESVGDVSATGPRGATVTATTPPNGQGYVGSGPEIANVGEAFKLAWTGSANIPAGEMSLERVAPITLGITFGAPGARVEVKRSGPDFEIPFTGGGGVGSGSGSGSMVAEIIQLTQTERIISTCKASAQTQKLVLPSALFQDAGQATLQLLNIDTKEARSGRHLITGNAYGEVKSTTGTAQLAITLNITQ